MKMYTVVVTADAKADLKRYRDYLISVKKSSHAAKNVVLDFRNTRKQLETVAGSLASPDSKALKARGLKRIYFLKHDYFLLFRVDDNKVYVTNMFHSREDYESKLQ